jgi:hypothetical protein
MKRFRGPLLVLLGVFFVGWATALTCAPFVGAFR